MFDYKCVCGGVEPHHYLCKIYNLRMELEKINNTGIAKHWREVEEIERLDNALSRIKNGA